MNEPEARGAVELLLAAFPRSVLSEDTKRFYGRIFRGCQVAATNEVIDALSDSFDMLPSPKAVREQINRLDVAEGGPDLRHAVRKQVAEYVAFRERMDQGSAPSFIGALTAHRVQCVENAREDRTGPWSDRVRAIDALLHEEGVRA